MRRALGIARRAGPRSRRGGDPRRRPAATPAPTVDRIWEVLTAFAVVRLLQGARGGVRAADLPVGLAQDPPPGGVPRRGAHPRPGHVPQAAHPRRRPQLRACRSSASTSTPPPRSTVRVESGQCGRPLPGLPVTAGVGIRLSLADVKGISGAEVARIVAGPPYADLDDFWRRAPGQPPGRRAARARRGVRRPATAWTRRRDGLGRRGRVTRRDLLLHVAELDRWAARPRPPAVRGCRAGLAAPRSGCAARRGAAGRGRGAPGSAARLGRRSLPGRASTARRRTSRRGRGPVAGPGRRRPAAERPTPARPRPRRRPGLDRRRAGCPS